MISTLSCRLSNLSFQREFVEVRILQDMYPIMHANVVMVSLTQMNVNSLLVNTNFPHYRSLWKFSLPKPRPATPAATVKDRTQYDGDSISIYLPVHYRRIKSLLFWVIFTLVALNYFTPFHIIPTSFV